MRLGENKWFEVLEIMAYQRLNGSTFPFLLLNFWLEGCNSDYSNCAWWLVGWMRSCTGWGWATQPSSDSDRMCGYQFSLSRFKRHLLWMKIMVQILQMYRSLELSEGVLNIFMSTCPHILPSSLVVFSFDQLSISFKLLQVLTVMDVDILGWCQKE